MISASKSTSSPNNLEIAKPKVMEILRICLKTFVNFDPKYWYEYSDGRQEANAEGF
jgi:hypothetical protein